MDGPKLKLKRISAGIPARLLSSRARVDRARLSDLERGYVEASSDELERLEGALSSLIRAREQVARVAAEVGWPL